MRVEIVGPTRLVVDGRRVELSSKERAVLAALCLDPPGPSTAEQLIGLIWGPKAPATARTSLHNHVSRIRKKAPGVVVTEGDGYRLDDRVSRDLGDTGSIDPTVLESVITDPDVLFADLAPHDAVSDRRAQVRLGALTRYQRCIEEAVTLGRFDEATTRAARLVSLDPYDETAWWHLASAEAGRGRRREALRVLDRARRTLGEIGLDPGARLTALERAILDDDPIVLTTPSTSRHPDSVLEPIGIDRIVGDLLGRLLHGPPGAIALTGQAGAGKSTVADAIARQAAESGATVVVTRCDPDATIPLGPVVDLVEQMSSGFPDLVAELSDLRALASLAPSLSRLAGSAETGGIVDRHRVMVAVRELVHRAPDRTLIVVEDVHWAPPRTVEALRAVASAAASSNKRCLVVMTARDDGADAVDHQPVEHHRVPRWSLDHLEQHLERFVDEPGRRRGVARWLLRQTGGLPMFARELTIHLDRNGLLGPAAADGPGRSEQPDEFNPPSEVPDAIAGALAGRVMRLTRDERHALECAAILSPRFPTQTLATMLGATRRADATIASLARRRMLTLDGEGAASLEHELLRRVVLDRTPAGVAVELHDLAVGALAPTASAMERARHAVAAASLDPMRAVSCARLAGEESLRRSSRDDAAEWWLRAADLIGRDGPDARTWCQLTIDAGTQLIHAGDPRARQVLFDAAEHAERRQAWDQAAQAAAVACRLGPTSHAGLVDDEAAALCERLLERVDDPTHRAPLAAASTMVHNLAGRAQLCRVLFERAVADARTSDSDEVWAHVIPYAYQSLPLPTDLPRRRDLTEELLRVADRLDRPDVRWSALHLRFANEVQLADPDARATAAELVALAESVREQSRDWETHYVRSTVHHLDGDLDRAEAAITSSLAYADTVTPTRVTAVYGVQLLAIRHQQRRLPELVEVITQLAESQPGIGAWRAALAFAAAAAGDHDRSVQAFDRTIGRGAEGTTTTLDRDQVYASALVALGEAAIELGDPDRAALVNDLLFPYGRCWTWTGSCTLGPVDTTLAGLASVLGHRSTARCLAERAIASAERLAAPRFAEAAAARAR